MELRRKVPHFECGIPTCVERGGSGYDPESGSPFTCLGTFQLTLVSF